MSQGLKYYKEGLEKSKEALILSIKERKDNDVFIYLAQYLFWVFAIFEKNKIDIINDNILRGMKRYYNILKHEYDQDAIIKKTIIISTSAYPRRYPYAYGLKSPIAKFVTIEGITPSGKEDIYYENNIKDKSVEDIINYITEKINDIKNL